MSKEELKQMIYGMVADDTLASQFQTTAQYRESLMEKIKFINTDYEFKRDKSTCYTCGYPLDGYGCKSPLDGERVCDECSLKQNK